MGRNESPSGVTALLIAHAEGDRTALSELFRLVFHELREMARAQPQQAKEDNSLDSVALVNGCYEKMIDNQELTLQDRGQFFAVAAPAMRHLIVDFARSRLRTQQHSTGGENDPGERETSNQTEMVLAVDQGIIKLAGIDPLLVRISECRFFAGLSVQETAQALDLSVDTVEKSLRAVRGFLGHELAISG